MTNFDYGAIGICIDEYDCGEMKGRVFGPSGDNPRSFRNIISMLRCIGDCIESNNVADYTINSACYHGKIATFKIIIRFRMNSSWQGNLFWIERNKEESFRSAMEMLMLMDSCFDNYVREDEEEEENVQ